jgi:hypothetical protein
MVDTNLTDEVRIHSDVEFHLSNSQIEGNLVFKVEGVPQNARWYRRIWAAIRREALGRPLFVKDCLIRGHLEVQSSK